MMIRTIQKKRSVLREHIYPKKGDMGVITKHVRSIFNHDDDFRILDEDIHFFSQEHPELLDRVDFARCEWFFLRAAPKLNNVYALSFNVEINDLEATLPKKSKKSALPKSISSVTPSFGLSQA